MQKLLGMIAGLDSNVAGNLLSLAGEKTLEKYKSASEWKKIFVDAGQFFIEHEKDANQFFDDLALTLSRENMLQLAKDLNKTDGFELKKRFEDLLMALMIKYEIPHELAYSYCQEMLYVILEQIKTIDPVKYSQYFLQDWRNEQEKSFQESKALLEKMSSDIRAYHEKHLNIKSAGQMDIDLRSQTINPTIGIDFFRIDDKEFQEKFTERLDDELIYIRGKSREETIYCILNELWKIREPRPIYVVKNNESWEKLQEISNENNIYIPWFNSEEIVAIGNNTNIFVLNENMPAYTRKVIDLRPRTFDTLTKCLANAGMDYNEAYALIADTHGLYIPMKKHLFKGQYMQMPEWVKNVNEKAKKICLLLGQWEEIDGDKLIIESLYGDTYETFFNDVLPYSKGEDPFLYTIKGKREKSYTLASTENTWECIDVSLEDPLWEKFIEIFIEVINESEELFTYSTQDRLLAQMKGEELFWSETIRKGMMKTLIMKGFYRNTENCQSSMDQLVGKILGFIKSERQWIYISRFWTDLCEISPKAVLDKLDQELEESTGLLCLFQNQTNDFVFGRNAYINILLGVEQFLTQKEFAWEGLVWLIKLDSYNFKYISNSPKSTLEKVFCPWYNFSAIRMPEEKIQAAKLACGLSDNVWKYLCDAISHNGRSIMGQLSAPKYRDHLIEQETTIEEMEKVSLGYFKLLLDKMDFSVDRWIDMLKVTEDLNSKLRKDTFDRLLYELDQMTDNEITKIKDEVREIIYRNRYFTTSSWALNEEQLQEYEQLLNGIHTCQPEYEYKFLFRKVLNFPLLHPVPYDEENTGNKVNEIQTEKLIGEKIEEFQKNGYNIELLAKICAEEGEYSLGEYMAQFWRNGKWDLETFKILLSADKSGSIAVKYMTNIFKKDVGCYPDIISKVKEWGYSKEILSKIYRAEAAWTEAIPIVEQASDDIKVLFWIQPLPLSANLARWGLSESKKYANFETFIIQMYWANDDTPLSAQEIYSYFEDIETMPHSFENQMTGWYLQKFLEILQQEYLYDDEKCLRISRIEIYFMNLIGWEYMKCFSHIIKKYPEVFVQLVVGICKKDHGESEKIEGNEQYFRNVYNIYDKAHFCPAEENGEVESTKLKQWVDKFKILLKENDQESLFGFMLGRLFTFSPNGKDGYKPCEAVREIIEEYSDEGMVRGYVTSIFNLRGIYNPSAGTEEMKMAKEFRAEAEYLKPRYPKTAEIFYELFHRYEQESKRERMEAENGQF